MYVFHNQYKYIFINDLMYGDDNVKIELENILELIEQYDFIEENFDKVKYSRF